MVDVGVNGDLDPAPNLLRRKVRHGTANIVEEPAMTRQEAQAALDVGAEVARELVASGARCLITGDMGIGNTTPSAALIAYFTGRPAADVVGRGTGIDDAMFTHKTAVVDAALDRTARDVAPDDPLGALASLGGLEIAALAGYIVGAGAAGVPVLIDGVIAAAALVTAAALCPESVGYCIAGHRSAEPGSRAVLKYPRSAAAAAPRPPARRGHRGLPGPPAGAGRRPHPQRHVDLRPGRGDREGRLIESLTGLARCPFGNGSS